MTKKLNKKPYLYYVYQILKEYSDPAHPITQTEIMRKISQNEDWGSPNIDRKTIYENIETLKKIGFEIGSGDGYGVFLEDNSRLFEEKEILYILSLIANDKSKEAIINKKELINKIKGTLSKKYQEKYFDLDTSIELKTPDNCIEKIIDARNHELEIKIGREIILPKNFTIKDNLLVVGGLLRDEITCQIEKVYLPITAMTDVQIIYQKPSPNKYKMLDFDNSFGFISSKTLYESEEDIYVTLIDGCLYYSYSSDKLENDDVDKAFAIICKYIKENERDDSDENRDGYNIIYDFYQMYSKSLIDSEKRKFLNAVLIVYSCIIKKYLEGKILPDEIEEIIKCYGILSKFNTVWFSAIKNLYLRKNIEAYGAPLPFIYRGMNKDYDDLLKDNVIYINNIEEWDELAKKTIKTKNEDWGIFLVNYCSYYLIKERFNRDYFFRLVDLIKNTKQKGYVEKALYHALSMLNQHPYLVSNDFFKYDNTIIFLKDVLKKYLTS